MFGIKRRSLALFGVLGNELSETTALAAQLDAVRDGPFARDHGVRELAAKLFGVGGNDGVEWDVGLVQGRNAGGRRVHAKVFTDLAHGVGLPLEEILFKTVIRRDVVVSNSFRCGRCGQERKINQPSVVVTLATLSDPCGATPAQKSLVHQTRHPVEVFVGLVSKTKHDKVHVGKRLSRGVFVVVGFVEVREHFGNLNLAAHDPLEKLDSIVGRLSFTVGGKEESNKPLLVRGPLFHLGHVVFFGVAHEGRNVEVGGNFLGHAVGQVFGGTGLRSIEKDDLLVGALQKGVNRW